MSTITVKAKRKTFHNGTLYNAGRVFEFSGSKKDLPSYLEVVDKKSSKKSKSSKAKAKKTDDKKSSRKQEDDKDEDLIGGGKKDDK